MLIGGLIRVSILQLWKSEESCQLSRGLASWSWSHSPTLGSMQPSHRAQLSGLRSALLVMAKFWILSFGDQHSRPFHREVSKLVSQPALNKASSWYSSCRGESSF